MGDLEKWLQEDDVARLMATDYVYGMTVVQIADKYNVSVATVRGKFRPYMPSVERIDAYRRKWVSKQLKNLRN